MIKGVWRDILKHTYKKFGEGIGWMRIPMKKSKSPNRQILPGVSPQISQIITEKVVWDCLKWFEMV